MMFKDPVCGKRIQRGKAHVVIEYEGVNYFLCCPRCQTEFEHNLRLYARPELGEKVRKPTRLPHRRYAWQSQNVTVGDQIRVPDAGFQPRLELCRRLSL